MTSAERVKRHIDQALDNREVRVAALIVESIRNALDLIDEQPAAVLAAMVERGKQRPSSSKSRQKVRDVLIEYGEERLHRARERERELAQAVTGAEHLPND